MLNAVPRLFYFQKKNVFTGDHQGMRMRLIMTDNAEGQPVLRAWVWEEPLCFEAAIHEDPADTADFAANEEGLAAAKGWFAERYTQDAERWQAVCFKPPV